jgi:hypothetical protein
MDEPAPAAEPEVEEAKVVLGRGAGRWLRQYIQPSSVQLSTSNH